MFKLEYYITIIGILFGGGRKNMNKEIVGIFVCMLLVATLLPITGSVIAGDEEDPEIEDEDGDT